jgi:hypothetical protein
LKTSSKGRRKRKPNPERSERNRKLREWSQAVRKRAGNKCEWCGAPHKYLNAHHIIGKRYEPFRYYIENGMALCPKCHKFGIGYSAHENPLNVFLWLQAYRSEELQFLIERMNRIWEKE